ncbi:MAG TPA: TetR family transcriptional regulator [Candidatus Dormibacteraeota bacterium]|nr:TetR family transcriptional regulator [Candidatus Dormibacteraeota bacterium]
MSTIFGAAAALPSGRHSLSREQVAESQRARLLAAVTELVAERGYASLTITEAARRARVAPNRFYEHFHDKEECFLAAYDAFAQALLRRMAAVTLAAGDWHDFIASTLDAYLTTLDAEPACARAFLVEMSGAGAEARRRRREMHSAFAALLAERHRRMRATDPRLGSLPESVYHGLVYAVRELACDRIERDPGRPLTELAPDILSWIGATVLGAGM